ncbi:MAG: flagellar motor protein [Terriglobales bacterium]
MDRSSSIGIVIALGGILTGLMLDGGNVGQIMQPTAALIVCGGTLGAVMLQFPMEVVMRGAQQFKTIFFHKSEDMQAVIGRLVEFAAKARKEGIVALDKDLESIQQPFLRKTIMLAVDGMQPEELRQNMEIEMGYQTEEAQKVIQVFDAAGGYSPTIGIIGAILGLIQVMQHLDQINEVGRGIAVAFVATVYGVAFANLIFLPMAGKLRLRRRELDLQQEVMLEGVVAILGGINPRMLESRLTGYLACTLEGKGKSKAKAESEAEAAPAGQPEAAHS